MAAGEDEPRYYIPGASDDDEVKPGVSGKATWTEWTGGQQRPGLGWHVSCWPTWRLPWSASGSTYPNRVLPHPSSGLQGAGGAPGFSRVLPQERAGSSRPSVSRMASGGCGIRLPGQAPACWRSPDHPGHPLGDDDEELAQQCRSQGAAGLAVVELVVAAGGGVGRGGWCRQGCAAEPPQIARQGGGAQPGPARPSVWAAPRKVPRRVASQGEPGVLDPGTRVVVAGGITGLGGSPQRRPR